MSDEYLLGFKPLDFSEHREHIESILLSPDVDPDMWRRGPVLTGGNYPEPLYLGEAGGLVGYSGIYYPQPPDWGLFFNPPRVTVGQVAAGDLLEAVMPFGKVDGAPFAHNIQFFRIQHVGANVTVQALAANLGAALGNGLTNRWVGRGTGGPLGVYDNGVGFGTGLMRIVGSTSDEATMPINAKGSLNQTDTVLPARRLAVVCSTHTGKAGRSFQGRMFFPSPGEDQQADGVLASTFVASMNMFLAGLRYFSDAAAPPPDTSRTNYQWCVYSRKLSKPNAPIVANIVTSAAVRTILGTVRGRQSVSAV